MNYVIQYESYPEQKDIDTLTQGLSLYAKQKKGHVPIELFAFFIRDESGAVKGGCNGNIGYGWLYVDQLWLDEALRNQDYGTTLMALAENLGREKGCVAAAVNTMDWEALGFYKKLGYRVEFERHGLAKESIYYFLRKDF